MGALEVWTTLHVLRPRTTKKLWPRGDTDNYEKGVWDAITNWQIWGDDDQIVINHTRKVFAVDIPHIEVLIKQIEVAKWKQSS